MMPCAYHAELVEGVKEVSRDVGLIKTDMAVLRRDMEHIMGRICQHIEDSEKTNGWRDRLTAAEYDIIEMNKSLATFRRFQLLYSAIGGIVGGLVGSHGGDAILGLLKHFGF